MVATTPCICGYRLASAGLFVGEGGMLAVALVIVAVVMIVGWVATYLSLKWCVCRIAQLRIELGLR